MDSINRKTLLKYLFGLSVILHTAHLGECGENCNIGHGQTEYCEYGCCNQGCCSYAVSTSVLIVAGIVGGLIVVALIVAIVICCVKTYRDKRTSRVRQLRPGHRGHDEDYIPRRPAEPRKPPTYIEAPPPYSSEMPESHYRPITVTGHHLSYNQRFRTPTMQNYGRHANAVTTTHHGSVPTVHVTQNSRRNHEHRNQVQRISVSTIQEGHESGTQQSRAQLPGTRGYGPPPAYSESTRSQSPGRRRRRFIQTPPPPNLTATTPTESQEETEPSRTQTPANHVENSNSENSLSPARHDIVTSRQSGRIANTQDEETNNLVSSSQALSTQVRTPSDLNSMHADRQTHSNTPVTSLSIARQQIRNSNMETAVARARSRQMATPVTTHNQAISRRHIENTRPITEASNTDIEELACL